MTRKAVAKLTKATSKATARLVADSGAVTIQAGVAEGEGKGPATFGGVAYSGGIVSRRTLTGLNLDADYVIDLAGMESRRSVKVNLDHKTSQRVGHLTEVSNDKKQLSVAGALSAATAYRDEVEGSASNGFEWEVSIEASLGKPTKLDRGKTATVNGRTVEGPLYIFANSTLTGLGFVSNGADEGNAITIAASAAGETEMNEFEKFAASLGVDLESITDDARANLQAVFDARKSNGGSSKNRQTIAQLAEAERVENVRQEAINTICLSAMKEHPMFIEQIKSLGEAAIESKQTSADQFELELIRATRTQKGRFSASMSDRGPDARVIEAALCMASGLPGIEKHYNEQTLDAVDRSGLRASFSLQQLLMQVAHANGYSCRAGERITVGNVRSVLEYCFPPVHARMAGFSTISLPNILGSVANKMILAGYMESDQTWKEIASIKPVSNFYTQNHYRMLDNLEYEEVGSGGELHHGTLGEETYTSQAKTYGRMLGITRTQMINDDLGAFDDLRARLGRGAGKKFSNVFWAAFMNNSAFFTAALTNYISGATTNLGTDGVGLGLMVAAFRGMTSPSADGSKRVGQDINPTIVLVPTELEANALTAYKNSNLGAVANSSANIYQNRFRPVVQWRLSNSSYTGYSTTAYYMFGDEVKPMLVTFLNGNQTPIVESTDADFNTLGIQFRGYHDFGCDKSEYLAGIKSKGAA